MPVPPDDLRGAYGPEERRNPQPVQRIPNSSGPLEHLRQKRHRPAAAAPKGHLRAGIVGNFGDNVRVEDGIVADKRFRLDRVAFDWNPKCR